jgi:hypothetical protein
MDSGFGNSIYWIFISCNYNFTSHKLETCLLCPVWLQASNLKKNPHSTASIESATVLICISLSLSCFRHPVNTVLRELTREHLIEGLRYLAVTRTSFRWRSNRSSPSRCHVNSCNSLLRKWRFSTQRVQLSQYIHISQDMSWVKTLFCFSLSCLLSEY